MDKTIEELQREKVELEIKDLKREWYKRKDYLQVLLPTTVALLSLIYALVSGFFNTKYEQLQLQKEQLKLEVLYFEEKREELILSNASLATSKDSLVNSLKNERSEMGSLRSTLAQKQNEIRQREIQLTELKSRKVYYEDEIKELQVAYNKKKKLLEGELEKQYLSESDLTRTIKEKDQTINTLKTQIDIFSYQTKIVEDNPYIQKGKRIEFAIWNGEEMIKYLSKDNEKNAESIRRLNDRMKRHERELDSIKAKVKVKRISN